MEMSLSNLMISIPPRTARRTNRDRWQEDEKNDAVFNYVPPLVELFTLNYSVLSIRKLAANVSSMDETSCKKTHVLFWTKLQPSRW